MWILRWYCFLYFYRLQSRGRFNIKCPTKFHRFIICKQAKTITKHLFRQSDILVVGEVGLACLYSFCRNDVRDSDRVVGPTIFFQEARLNIRWVAPCQLWNMWVRDTQQRLTIGHAVSRFCNKSDSLAATVYSII